MEMVLDMKFNLFDVIEIEIELEGCCIYLYILKCNMCSVYNFLAATLFYIISATEFEDGINSIYEQTSAGSYIDSLAQSVENEIDIYAEPSIQGGQGTVTFRDSNTDEVLLEKDYQEFCNDIIDMALESKV